MNFFFPIRIRDKLLLKMWSPGKRISSMFFLLIWLTLKAPASILCWANLTLGKTLNFMEKSRIVVPDWKTCRDNVAPGKISWISSLDKLWSVLIMVSGEPKSNLLVCSANSKPEKKIEKIWILNRTYLVNSLVPLIGQLSFNYYSHSTVCQNYAPVFLSYETTPCTYSIIINAIKM